MQVARIYSHPLFINLMC